MKKIALRINGVSFDHLTPTVKDVRYDGHEAEIELEQTFDGKSSASLLQLRIEDGKIVSGHLCHPSFRCIK